MKKILTLLLIIALSLPAAAQVGRYKSLKTIYPGYSLKFDTANGELAAMHLDEETGVMKEEIISRRLSHGRKVGRYELRRGVRIASYQIFDTSTGEYTTVKWTPKEYEADQIGGQVDTAITKTVEKIRQLLKGLEETLKEADHSGRDTIVRAGSAPAAFIVDRPWTTGGDRELHSTTIRETKNNHNSTSNNHDSFNHTVH